MENNIVLPEDVIYLLDTLNKNGYEAYIVGGCVRDSILGRQPQDWDITTSALPEETKSLFPHTFDTGIQHGTITVVRNKVNYEITTYRLDGEYHDGRHPDAVQFTPDLKEDLLRRDFTMNAIAYHPKEGFQDPFSGREDIARELIRGVGVPAKRFQEDALRMLRCVRFAAQLGFAVEEETRTAMAENAALIEKISAERIHEELDKLWRSPYPEKLPLLLESGLLPHIDHLWAEQMGRLGEGLIPQLKAAPNTSACRWTLVLQNYREAEAKAFCKKLKFDNSTMKEIVLYLRHFHEETPQTAYGVRKLAGTLGEDITRRLFRMQAILHDKTAAQKAENLLDQVLAAGDCLNLKGLAVNGEELMAAGIPKGKHLGAVLNALLEDVLREPAHNEKNYLLQEAQKRKDEV
ncbi:CCA tRNA nucleotidyltransferase [Anaerotignum lactatifermentans]|uniref:CCA tRNA nucleotidyltransferase n=1 Tax=Anaerotignum lactatifermentans TaxID=160404 RepID=A0ABS2G9D5_9FIRM|nr:CCA tRNA nucleotidyltransferase [Anaerotignum lactatifermentans]MBM6829134.1 CCA tRNA nucleotidyltransferase [Anaerotignum lactatifermentans]MBM6877258.1 CCA tRNA nucleotidyltransferase [Anaerotignum lactatifermentans]MBM6950631.1 CCA tRNA nucleotidyltransferase [Anaerotignum lactatifermentans]